MGNPYDIWCESCGCLMKKRRGKFGEFYGCTAYPKCTNTMRLRDAELKISQQLGVDGPEHDWDGYAEGGDYDPGGTYD